MPKETEKQKGYNEAANDLAIALQELHQNKYIDISALVARFQELRKFRFEI